jgi:hypothetical protein
VRISLLMSLSLVLAACALQRAQQAQDAKRQLVGMTDEKIFACMGPPRGHSTLGSTDVWQYNSGNGHVQTGAVVTANSGIVSGSAVTTARFCTVNIAMSNRVVQSVNYSGPTGGVLTEGEQCAFAVKACLPPQ